MLGRYAENTGMKTHLHRLAMILLGITLAIWGIYGLTKAIRFNNNSTEIEKNGIETWAIVSGGYQSKKNGTVDDQKLEFTYSVDDVKYSKSLNVDSALFKNNTSTSSYDGKEFKIGNFYKAGSIKVKYNPSDPSSIRLPGKYEKNYMEVIFAFIFGGFGVLLAGAHIYEYLPKKMHNKIE